jgi:carbon monoxide dehydrogenase subunit G
MAVASTAGDAILFHFARYRLPGMMSFGRFHCDLQDVIRQFIISRAQPGATMDILAVSRVINAPIDEVWAVTSSFGALQAWMPGVEKVSIKGAGVSAVRTVTLAAGVAEEHLRELDYAHHRVRYALPVSITTQLEGMVGGTDLQAIDANTTRITWVVLADKATGDLAPVRASLTMFINGCIDGLARLLKTTAGPAG